MTSGRARPGTPAAAQRLLDDYRDTDVKHGTPDGARSGCPCEWCAEVRRGDRVMAAGVGRRAHDDTVDAIIELLDRGRRLSPGPR